MVLVKLQPCQFSQVRNISVLLILAVIIFWVKTDGMEWEFEEQQKFKKYIYIYIIAWFYNTALLHYYSFLLKADCKCWALVSVTEFEPGSDCQIWTKWFNFWYSCFNFLCVIIWFVQQYYLYKEETWIRVVVIHVWDCTGSLLI
jgi:hypothetical protein